MRISAKFIGENSLGYIKNRIYTLIIRENIVCRYDGTGICPYSTLESFFKNWKVI